jgi:hypothetical protein
MNDEEVVYLLAALERELDARLLMAGCRPRGITRERRALVNAARRSFSGDAGTPVQAPAALEH